MTRHIALLRGINLGAHRRVAMGDLRALLTESGHGDVRTQGQSGNVVLTSGVSPQQLGRELEELVATRLGITTQVVVRTHDELAGVVRRNPLGDIADDPRRYQVNFLSAEPERQVVRAMAAVDVAPEQWVHSGREIFAWHPGGIQNSPLAKLLTERRLGVTPTARNWATIGKLLALAEG